MSRAACPPTVYLVAWPGERIIKAGYSAAQRWRDFEIRGADLAFLARPGSANAAFALEAAVGAVLRYGLEDAFESASDAIPYLGARGGGYLECYRAPDQETYGKALRICEEVMRLAHAPSNAPGICPADMHERTERTNELTESPTPDSDQPRVSNAHEIQATTNGVSWVMTDEVCLCTGTPKCWVCETCPDHPTIPRADCVCAYPGEEPCMCGTDFTCLARHYPGEESQS